MKIISYSCQRIQAAAQMAPACILNLALIAAVLGAVGCASSGHDKSESTAISLQASADKIVKGQGIRDQMLTALNDLVNNPQADLRPQFKKFTSAFSDFESIVKDVQGKVASMQGKGAAYFEKWDADLAKIQNEDIRSRSLARKSEVSDRFAKIKASYAKVGETFKPFMSNLTDIKTALSTDLTRGGLDAIKPVVEKANKDAVPLREAVNELVADFKAVGVAMSAVAPQPAK